MAGLEEARRLAARVRVREGEVKAGSSFPGVAGVHQHRGDMLLDGLLISSSVTPILEDSLQEVCNTLCLPRGAVTGFVWNHPVVQADCAIRDENSCVIRFTSALINLMSVTELKFIIGHELAHFLLLHTTRGKKADRDSALEEYASDRIKELSADRIGLIGCADVNLAARAIIKTASGLGEGHLRFDVAAFLRQVVGEDARSFKQSGFSTHPSLLVRCRALMWFEMELKNSYNISSLPDSRLRAVDRRVFSDLEKFVDSQIGERKEDLLRDLTLWEVALLVLQKGRFKKSYQDRFVLFFGREELESLKNLFRTVGSGALRKDLVQKKEALVSDIDRQFPESAKAVAEKALCNASQIVKD